MDTNIIERFKAKKKKVITSYAKVLEMIITLEKNTLWHNPNEFVAIAEGVINSFVENYYFDNNLNRNNPVEYLNDNINAVIISIMDYYKSINKMEIVKTKKNETFLLSTIICTASFVDIAANIIDGSYPKMKKNLQKLLKHLSQTEILKIYYNNKMYLDKLCLEVRKNIRNEKKFFSYFKNEHWHNEYQLITKEPEYYKVRFIYKIDGLNNKDPKTIKHCQKTYLRKYLEISYELLIVLIMKEYIMNKQVNVYLVPTIDEVLNKEINCLDIPLVKNNVKLLAPLEKYDKYKNITQFEVVYFYKGNNKDELLTKRDIEVIVNKDFLKDQDMAEYQKLNINLIAEELGKNMTENEICQIKEED